MLALVYLGVAICVGERLCGQFYRFVSTTHRWATGALVGLLLSSCFTYLAARHFASASNPLLLGDILFFAVAAIFLLKCPPKPDRMMITTGVPRSAKSDWITLGIFCALGCWMTFATLDIKNGMILIGTNQWSDYGPNTAIVQNFAFGHNYPAEYPHFAHEPIRYHFMFYFLAGNLEFLGLNLAWSLNLISVLTTVCMLAVVMALGELLFKTRAVGILAAVFFFFHGTLSLIPFLRSQPSVKAALLASYNLISYLSSGYPYRGEDWGIWSQVVFVNQRHFASSIGIFLVVLFFLFDRYMEAAKQRKLSRALAAGPGPIHPPAATMLPIATGISARHEDGGQATDAASVDEARTSAELQPTEQWPPTPETSSIGEVHPSGTSESPDESAHANHASVGEAETWDTRAYGEQSRPEQEAISVSGTETSHPGGSLEGSEQAANDTSPAGAGTPGAVAYDEGWRPEPETDSVGEAKPSRAVESPGGSSQAANYASSAKAGTPDTVAYDQGWHPEPETGSVGEAKPSGTVESGEGSVQAANDAPAGEAGIPGSVAYDQGWRPGPEIGSVGEAKPSGAVESREGSVQAANDELAGEAGTPGTLAYDKGWRSEPETGSVGEAKPSGAVESREGSVQAANDELAGEAGTPSPLAFDKGWRSEPETGSVGEAKSSGAVESREGSVQAANDELAGEAGTPGTLAYDEGWRREPDAGSAGEAEPSRTVESLEASSQVASQASAGEAPAFATGAYDEDMDLEPDPALAASEAEEAEALAFVKQSSHEHDKSLIPSRGIVAEFVHDNLVNGKGFIFSGLLLGAMPYWNAPVFTAAAAVLAFLFFLFPCRRYMVGLAITAAAVGIPQVLALRSGNARAGASLIHWGYTLGNVPVSHVLKYLGWTFGVKWVLILVALLFFSWRNLRLFLAIFSLFLLTFCLQFSDEALANHKFLNIWLVVANLFAGYGLWRLWHTRIKGWALPFRLIALVLVAPIFAGGIIDFFPIHNVGYIFTNYTKDRLIDWIRAETKPDAVFLSDKFVNHPILLAGRRIFYGYTYFTWGAGYDLPKREAMYTKMFESKNAQQVFTLLKANNIDYVAFDNGIRGFFKNSNEQQVYAASFPKVFEGTDYWNLVIYKVPENADFVPTAAAAVPGSSPTPTPEITVFEGGKGKENGQLDFPRGLAVDNAGNIFIADTNNGRIQKFSPTGVFLSAMGKTGDGPGEFRGPGGIAVDSSGYIYVADVENHRVQKLKPDGTFLAAWRGPEPGFYGPRDIFIGVDNSIYVVDQGHSRIVKLDSNGKVMVAWGSAGTEDGQFTDATSVAVDGKTGRVYVADPRNKRIEVFDTNGKFLAKWPVEEWSPNGWYFQDLVIDSEAGRLYASSNATDEVLAFDLTGKKIASLKPQPPDKLEGPSSLALVKGKLLVLDTYASHLSSIELEKK